MIKRIINLIYDVRDRQRMAIALSKGAAMMLSRNIDLQKPATWEFSGFSQNGEDGIINVLTRQLLKTNRYFVEVGSADGIENNTSWLAVAEKYHGLMIEGNSWLVNRTHRMVVNLCIGSECINMFVSVDNINELISKFRYRDPDVFSLDIDGNDFYIAKALFENGVRPKVFVVEYNSVFGPKRRATIKYNKNFVFTKAHPTHLYYGVSISGWRSFFESHGYKFVTVDRNGVNAFFVDPSLFKPDFIDGIEPLEFAENQYQLKKFHQSSEDQFKMIADQDFVTI